MIDFNLNTDSVVISTDEELITQQLDILFDTKPGDVLGQSEYGTRYDKFLYDLTISNDAIRQKVTDDINELQLFGYKPTVNVYLLHGTQNDILLLDIHMSRGDYSFEKTYKVIE